MKRLFLLFGLVFSSLLISTLSSTATASAAYVRGYYKSNGNYVNSYYRSTPKYKNLNTYTYTAPKYSYRNSYTTGLKWQNTYYKPSTGKYVKGHYKTYSDGYSWNNRKSLYGW